MTTRDQATAFSQAEHMDRYGDAARGEVKTSDGMYCECGNFRAFGGAPSWCLECGKTLPRNPRPSAGRSEG